MTQVLFRILAVVLLAVSIELDDAFAQHAPTAVAAAHSKEPVTARAEFRFDKAGRRGKLFVSADMRDGFHIYAMTQPEPFIGTEIRVDDSSGITLSDEFVPARPPQVHRHDEFDCATHEYERQITWSADFTVTSSTAPEQLTITGSIYAQACSENGCSMP